MSDAVQALCFLAGANSIFYGEKLLTTPNPGRSRDAELFARLGLVAEGGAESAAGSAAAAATTLTA
jgi:biotin synthase